MMSLLLLLLSLPIIFILYFQTQKSKNANKLSPPGPPRLPIIGNFHQFDGQDPYRYLQRLSKQYGPVMSLKFGARNVVVISTVEAVKEITRSTDAIFSSRVSTVAGKRVSYNYQDIGFSSYNDTWRELRKIATFHLLSPSKVQENHFRFRDELSKMMEKIARDASSSNAINFRDMSMSLFSNILSSVLFGKTYDGDRGYGRDRYIDLLDETRDVLAGFYFGDFFPRLRWMDSLFGLAARLEKNFQKFDAFCQEVVEEHMNPNRPKSMDGDLTDILLKIKENGSSSFPLTLDHIKAIQNDLSNGGSDSSATALAWTMTLLMKKPLLMKKLQEEIRGLAGKKDMIDRQDIQKLPYLRAVVKEGLRLYPPAPLLVPRETTTKCVVNGCEIEGGSFVIINAYAIGRDPAAWENPDEFLPERYLDLQNPEVIAFGFGRRGCPGIVMAIAELELALANLVYKFNWELPGGMKEEDLDFECEPGHFMHKKNAFCLVPRIVI
ncbi:cytochrome P450 71A1-like [Salvia splendens]|uniref:cytochrome P450 71A1-like n=1 Tax=Salvia splendens TaxID=180675 RepID=UPI001C2800D6|nr:cytochrome P450 71A1-like [Salvia splendens]